MQKLITVTTDFGDSFATAQLKAVVNSLGFEGQLIENHDVYSFSVIEGAFQISTLSKFCPKNSIHVGVIDPGVGSSREGIIIQTRNHWYVGPNNGLLYPSANADGILNVWKLIESSISEHVSNTFHGRDVFIKAAVYLAQGRHPLDFNSIYLPIKELITAEFKDGHVLHIDHYGNLKIEWQKTISLGQQLYFEINNQTIDIPIVKTFSGVSPGHPVALLGSSNTLELAINLGNFAKQYLIKTGQILNIKQK